MSKRLLLLGQLALCFLSLAAGGLHRIKINGDGGEYLLMTHALAHHGSATIRPDDVDTLRTEAQQKWDNMNFPGDTYAKMEAYFKKPNQVQAYGFASVEPDRYYSIHFWLYSLLAVPFYAIVSGFGQNPLFAFGLLNACCVFATLLYLRRAMPQHHLLASLMFLVGGSSFYLNWTGPETMCACSALIACVATLRGEVGTAIFMAGLGASQNPSLIFIMPCCVAWRLLLWRWPALAWNRENTGNPMRLLKPGTILLALGGVALALLPYAFFDAIFGMPSLTGKYFTSTTLITANRLVSLLADFDQGMLFGLPGLFLAPLLAVFLLPPGSRKTWVVAAIAMIALLLVMAVPTLGAKNWNSGCVVVLRYGYWLAMPLLAMAFFAMTRLSRSKAAALAAAGVALQTVVFAQYGFFGQDSDPLAHSKVAEWVLEHHPSLYHPDPEIFFERSVHAEITMPHNLTYVYSVAGHQLKLMHNASNLEPDTTLCTEGMQLQGVNPVKADRNWEYEDPPFRCQPITELVHSTAWRTMRGNPDAQALLGAGWSELEPHCTWTNGTRAEMRLPLPADGKALRLRTLGHYYLDQDKSQIEVDGETLPAMDLQEGVVDLPASFNKKPGLSIVLRHPQAMSPAAHGNPADDRLLGFCMEMISVETLPD